MGKMISVSFYFGEINRAAFERKFGLSIEAVFPNEVAFVLERGLMEYTDTTLRLTPLGAQDYNGVIALFYAPAVQEHLLKLVRGERTRPVRGWRKVWQPEYEALKLSTVSI